MEVLIDKNFYGLTQLYTPGKEIKLEYISFSTTGTYLKYRDADKRVSIIAVSGLNGHTYSSWAGEADSEGCKKMWLRHLFEKDRPECRTMIFGYDSRLNEPGIHTLSHYSSGLLEEIDKARKGCEV